jgi:effector-binding domain-containing protein
MVGEDFGSMGDRHSPAASRYSRRGLSRMRSRGCRGVAELECRVDHEVIVKDVEARPTAVVAATTTWSEFPVLWKRLLDDVWACLRAGGIERGCRNIMLYRDDVPNVEVGVELTQPCRLTDPVVASALPAGPVAMTVHHGPYSGLGDAHQAVHAWCAANGRTLSRTRWEVYGPHNDDPAQVWTEVYWLLG